LNRTVKFLIRLSPGLWEAMVAKKKVAGISYTWQIITALRTFLDLDEDDRIKNS